MNLFKHISFAAPEYIVRRTMNFWLTLSIQKWFGFSRIQMNENESGLATDEWIRRRVKRNIQREKGFFSVFTMDHYLGDIIQNSPSSEWNSSFLYFIKRKTAQNTGVYCCICILLNSPSPFHSQLQSIVSFYLFINISHSTLSDAIKIEYNQNLNKILELDFSVYHVFGAIPLLNEQISGFE